MAKKKSWLKSKTIWVNAIIASLAIVEANTQLLQSVLPTNIYVIVAIVLPIINIFLRTITTEAIVSKKE